MFQRVMDWLEAEPEGQEEGFDDFDVRLSIAALFYHMIAVDGKVTTEETDRLDKLLKRRFNLNKEQLAQLELAGEQADRSSAGLFPFTVILNRELNERQRKQVLEQLMQLAEADGHVDLLELDLLEHVKILLKLSD